MTDSSPITERQRRILVSAAGKLGSSSQPGEREVVFQRINRELEELRISWIELFEAGLPRPEAAPPAGGGADLMAAADAMMAGFADFARPSRPAAEPRRLSGDEIPPSVQGTASVLDERAWRMGTMMFVQIRNDEFVYGPMVVFQQESQDAIRAAERDGTPVVGRVDHPHDTARSPVLHHVHPV